MKISLHTKAVMTVISLHVFGALPAIAEPSPTVTKLMNTPVSLMSYGLYRLQERMTMIAKRFPPNLNYLASVSYDWNTTRITLTFSNTSDPANSSDAFEAQCSEIIGIVRREGWIEKTGKPAGDSSIYAIDFFPDGYSVPNLSTQDAVAIDALLELNVVSYGGTFRQCTAPLLGTGYSVTKQ